METKVLGMTGTKRRIRPQEVLFFCAAALFVLFFFGELDLRGPEQTWLSRIRDTAVFAALMVAAPAAARRLAGQRRIRAFLSGSEGRNLLLLAALAVIPRAVWQAAVPARIGSDYALYVRMGAWYAENGVPLTDNYLLTVAPNAVTYSVLTGLLMRLFGTSAATLAVFAAALNTACILLLYRIGRKLASAPRAFAAAAVFALLPENVFYSNVPGIEAPALFTILLGLLLILSAKGRKPAAGALLCFGGGIALGVSACIRANAYAALIAAGILLLRQREPEAEKAAGRRILLIAALAAGTAAALFAQQGLKGALFTEKQPASGLGWPIYEGLDLENGGKWTPEKSARCIEVINAYEPAEADAVFLREGLARFRGYSFGQKLRMFLRKGGALWYETRYALFALEGTEAEIRLNRAAHLAWAACLAAFAAGLLYRSRRPVPERMRPAACLAPAVILMTTAWHMAGTSIGRYHYMLIPFVLITAAMLLPGRGDGKERRDGE